MRNIVLLKKSNGTSILEAFVDVDKIIAIEKCPPSDEEFLVYFENSMWIVHRSCYETLMNAWAPSHKYLNNKAFNNEIPDSTL